MNKPYRSLLFRLILGAAAIASFPVSSLAGYWEFSTGFNYNRSEYSAGSYSWTRRLGGSIGYNFNDSSTLELGYQKSFERNHYEGFEDSFYRDEVISANIVWNLLGRTSMVQPYLKLGVGQLNRKANINNTQGQTQSQELNQLTGVTGAGLKIYMTKEFAIRMEATSFLAGGKLSTWRRNIGATFGISLYY